MINTRSLPVSPDQQLRNIGWNWMLGTDTLSYLTNEVVVVSPAEADAYYEAGNQVFTMLVEAGQHVIDTNRFSELGIPDSLIDLIKLSWSDDRHIQLYGRFDFAGGIDGQPIKLIEFNADTATCIPETAVVQYAHLRANGLDEEQQFNSVYETLVEQFRDILLHNEDKQPTLLLSAMRGFPEDDSNLAVLGEAAREAGFTVEFEYIDKVEFSVDEGIFKQNPENGQFDKFDFWFKLVPWEYIGHEESDLAHILTEAVRRRQVVILNPAYSLLFQSKYILKILWELYPFHPLLPENRQSSPSTTGCTSRKCCLVVKEPTSAFWTSRGACRPKPMETMTIIRKSTRNMWSCPPTEPANAIRPGCFTSAKAAVWASGAEVPFWTTARSLSDT